MAIVLLSPFLLVFIERHQKNNSKYALYSHFFEIIKYGH